MYQAKLYFSIDLDEIFPVHADMILPQWLVKRWHITFKGPFSLSCGSANSPVRVIHSQKASSVRIRKTIAKTLGLYQEGNLNLRYFHRYRSFQIGPVLGILTNAILTQAADEERFGDMTRFYTECQLSAQKKGIRTFIFSPDEIHTQSRWIRGWTRLNGQWKQAYFPLPDVIYNRITSRRVESRERLQQKIRWLCHRHHIQLFNTQFLDKWQVHSALWKDNSARLMLPDTKMYESPQQLKEMLKMYPIVYLKPVNGSLGQGVMRLALKGKQCHMQYTTLNGTITKSSVTLQEVARHMSRRMRHGKYLIQQGLPLITSLGRPIDFRALLQKNGEGKWSLTSIVGRIAGDSNIVSNLSRGGTIANVPHIIQQVDPDHPRPSPVRLRQHALKVAYAFERQLSGHFAELGIDLAVDMSGKVWLLEINSKPSKTDDALTNPTRAIRPSVHKTMDYTCFITGYSQSTAPGRASTKRR